MLISVNQIFYLYLFYCNNGCTVYVYYEGAFTSFNCATLGLGSVVYWNKMNLKQLKIVPISTAVNPSFFK